MTKEIPKGLTLERAQILGLQRSHEEMTERLDRLTATIERLDCSKLKW